MRIYPLVFCSVTMYHGDTGFLCKVGDDNDYLEAESIADLLHQVAEELKEKDFPALGLFVKHPGLWDKFLEFRHLPELGGEEYMLELERLDESDRETIQALFPSIVATVYESE